MNNLFKEFDKTSKADWSSKIEADLKGKDPSLLIISNLIEDIEFSSYFHQEDMLNEDELPGNYPNKRGMNSSDNSFNNGKLIQISSEKEANKKSLDALNSGADLLVFKATKENIDWKTVLSEIQFEYIQCQFVIHSVEEFKSLFETLQNKPNIQYNIDFHSDGLHLTDVKTISPNFKETQQRFCAVNGFKVQQSGANAWQELAFCLSTAHEYLVELMQNGFTIDDASACITFNVGMGSNYFLETAKIRSLKQLWSKIIRAYSPEHACSYNCHITAVVTHLNKSLKDPHTNLLRQTTETMSAVNAGIDGVVILPYDIYSTNGESELAERMALNISSILSEESYFNKVIDPLGGSYSVEKITELIGRKSWIEFQEIDQQGGIFSEEVQADFVNQVEEKKELRINMFNEGSISGIGMNIYPPLKEEDNNWALNSTYIGMKPLILEKEYKTVVA